VELVAVDVDPVTKRAVPGAMAAAMDAHAGRVVLVAVSAPSYAHGVVDPVGPVAAAAAERGIRCHVDACIGGWVLPWAGLPEPWHFACPGVTSVSADLHKYAYTPKGVSLLLHRSPALRRPQFFASADWPGYTMLNATMQSTRSGGPLAAAWAVVQHIRRGRLRRADRHRPGRDPPHRRRRRPPSRTCAWPPRRTPPCSPWRPTRPWTCSPWPTRWASAAGTCSRRWRSATCPRPCT
jgi:glutamate/tyrosine decarboxylase-like PLP-dependent enzyme